MKNVKKEKAGHSAGWLLLVFSLPSKRTSERVEVWRRLKRIGALPLGPPGYLLPHTQQNQEQFEWLAAAIRGYKGQASVIQVHAIDDLPPAELRKRFSEARTRDYQELIENLEKMPRDKPGKVAGLQLARLQRRMEEIRSIDFFHSPLRQRAEDLLQRVIGTGPKTKSLAVIRKSEFQNKTWATRPRPGIDRVSSAWLIRKFIDPEARFVFSAKPSNMRNAIPFDTFEGIGFTHEEDRCTFETLCNKFGVRDPKALAIGQIVHDADLRDDKFGRAEGQAIEAVLVGWEGQSIDDHELLRRGMELFEGLYRSM
jgi:hypothetical protein